MCFTSRGLTEYARANVGNPYIYGTYGTLGNEKLLATKHQQYPNYMTERRVEIVKANPEKYFNKPWHDCAGLIKGYLMKKGITVVYQSRYDLSANGFYSKSTRTGDISSIPEVPGLGLWKNNHVGIYIGGGRCIQAKGFDYGVVESDIKGFEKWFEIPFIDYVDEAAPQDPEPVQDVPPVGGRWIARVKTESSPLNIRALASGTSRIVGSLPKNSLQVFIDEPVNGFAKLADGRGFASMAYLSKE